MLSAVAALSVFAYVIDLADDTKSAVQYNIPKGYAQPSVLGLYGTVATDQAMLTAKCNGVKTSVGMWKNMDQDSNVLSQPIVEFINMPHSCVNKLPHLEPCVPHDLGRAGPPNVPNAPSYFKCRFDGPNASISLDMPPPFVEWVYVDKIRVDYRVLANCTTPTLEQIREIAGITNQDGELTVSVHIEHRVNGTTPTEIEFSGVTGANELRLYNLVTPPMNPQPPGAPPPPLGPYDGPGGMFQSIRAGLDSMQFGDWPGWSGFRSLCWSSERGDTWHSSVWHSGCNDRGSTVYIARVKYSSNEFVVGSYQRITWAGSGYSGDSSGAIFQMSPSVWKSVAGSGPYGAANYGMYRSNNYGPTFGNAHDWHVSSNMKTGYVNMGYAYKCRTGNYGTNTCRNDFIGSYSSWSVQEAEMWSTD